MLRFLLVFTGICIGLGIALVSAEMIEKKQVARSFALPVT